LDSEVPLQATAALGGEAVEVVAAAAIGTAAAAAQVVWLVERG